MSSFFTSVCYFNAKIENQSCCWLVLLQWPLEERPWPSYYPSCSSLNPSLFSKYHHLFTSGPSSLFNFHRTHCCHWSLIYWRKLDLASLTFIPLASELDSYSSLTLYSCPSPFALWLILLSLRWCQRGLVSSYLWRCFFVMNFDMHL